MYRYSSYTKNGLAEKEVEQSREKYGENRLSKRARKGFLMSFLESFGDPMIKILLIALAINMIFLFRQASWFESAAIGFAILLATLVSTISQYGSESAFEKLQEEASRIHCRVQRASGVIQIPMEEIVVGDLVLLQSGDRVPADGVIIDGKVDVDQSSLNGESKEAQKFASYSAKIDMSGSDFLNPSLLFSATVVCAGECLMRVTKVGDETFYGKIGAEVQEETRQSPLKLRLGKLASSIGKLGYVAAVFTVFACLFHAIIIDNQFNFEMIIYTLNQPEVMFQHILKAATLAVTVIVMAVPEGLPMMVTVVLSANMKRMLKDNVLVRKLVGIETAGSLNLLFTDKTGTLTQGKLDVTHFISGSNQKWTKKEAASKQTKLCEILHDSVIYNNAASMNEGTAIGGNATDRATLEFVSQLKAPKKQIKKTNVIPFTSEAKFMATSVSGDWNGSFIKGAPEKILPYCTHYYDEKGIILPFTDKSKIEDTVNQLAQQAIRMIAVAACERAIMPGESRFQNLKLIGLLGIRDEIRPEAASGIRQAQDAGIQTVMITGDSPVTALAIAKEVGLVKKSSDIILTSEELNALSDKELSYILRNLRVVARALPNDKSRLVRIAQEKNLVVGMTGDGVNDAPALKKADIGFAMGSGTEVAKEAGDIVILDNNFNSIAKAISYGRTIFKSIRKFIIYQLSICMCAVGVTVIGPLINVDFPITVIQMLWINIVMDTLAGLAFSGEKPREHYMREPPKKRDEPILNNYMKGQITVSSIYSTLLCLFFLKNSAFQNSANMQDYVYKMTAFFGLFMFLAIYTSFCARTHYINLFKSLAVNKPFLIIMGLVTVIQVFIIYYGGTIFRTVKLELNDMILIVGLASTIIPVDMIRKYIVGKNCKSLGT